MGKGNRNRQTTRDAGKQAGGSRLWIKIVGWTLGVLFLIVLVFGLLHTTGILQRNITAVTVGEYKLSALDYNILYMDLRNNFISQNGSTLQALGVTIDSSFDSQPSFYEESGTWRDYLNEQTLDSVHNLLSLYGDAKKAGHEVKEEYTQLVNDQIASLLEAAMNYGYTLDGYISLVYGNGTKQADIERVYNMTYYAESYGASIRDQYDITDPDIEAYYQENRETYDLVDYYSHTFAYETFTYTVPAEGESVPEGQPASEEEATQMTEASKAEAKAQADAFLARLSAGEDFDTVAKDYFDAEEATHDHSEDEENTHAFETGLKTGARLSASGTLIDWLKDGARKAGDREAIDNGSSSYIVAEYVSRYREELPTATARHILFSVSELAEDATEEQKSTHEFEKNLALQKAQAVLAEWQTGEATEESFGELAKTNSADGNAAQGGIYEHFSKGAMVEPFDSWVFDDSRKLGDTGIVETQYGYHVMYFVSFDRPSYYYTINDQIISDTFAEDLAAIVENYPITSSSLGMKICF